MLVDFHTHTTASDGALSPRQLLERAAAEGIAMLAITDHDTVDGYLAAADLAHDGSAPVLVPGIEYSCQWSGTTIHVLGLGIDCRHPAMREGLAELGAARIERARKIAERLARRGFDGALEGALEQAGDSQLGRPHFAAWLVDQGHMPDHNTAFDKLLGQGKTGDVKAFWPSLERAVGWITAAGGVAVLAHPLKYNYTRMKLGRLVRAFAEAGGGALEILSGRQSADQVARLQRLAEEYALQVSVGSDFHRDAPYSAPLGVELRPYRDCAGVWTSLAPAPIAG